jgi:hypothetical protein
MEWALRTWSAHRKGAEWAADKWAQIPFFIWWPFFRFDDALMASHADMVAIRDLTLKEDER